MLRGANDYMLDEMERSIHDSLSIVKRALESNTVSGCLALLLNLVPTALLVATLQFRIIV